MLLTKLSDARHIDIHIDMNEPDVTSAVSQTAAAYDDMLRPNSSVWTANQPSGKIVHICPDREWRYEERTRGRLPAFSSETID